ncbi:MAG: hypothetical protein JXA30_14555 [Deltaproteobacteria bacterium]|nr:hypothetical protein [Deltaproteobacteria bacterium]
MNLPEKLIDKRVVGRNLKKGRLSSEDYRRLLNELPDRSDNIFKSEETEQEDGVPRPGELTGDVEARAALSPQESRAASEPIGFDEPSREPAANEPRIDSPDSDFSRAEAQSEPRKAPSDQG